MTITNRHFYSVLLFPQPAAFNSPYPPCLTGYEKLQFVEKALETLQLHPNQFRSAESSNVLSIDNVISHCLKFSTYLSLHSTSPHCKPFLLPPSPVCYLRIPRSIPQ